MAVDIPGHLLALYLTQANIDDHTQVGRIAETIQDATRESVNLVYIDQGYMGEQATEAASSRSLEFDVVKLPEAKRGFVLQPKR